MHTCTDTTANLHVDQYFFNQIATMYDVENREVSVSRDFHNWAVCYVGSECVT